MSTHTMVATTQSPISYSSIFLCSKVLVGNFQGVHDGKRSQENLAVVFVCDEAVTEKSYQSL